MRKRVWPILIACALRRYEGAQAGTVAGAIAQDRPPHLLTEVVVQKESIQLSDLLPHDVSPAMLKAAQEVRLGRAPEPGSIRVLTLEELRSQIQPQIRVTIPEQIVVRRAGYAVSRERVRGAVQALLGTKQPPEIGISTAPELVTSRPDPELRATGTIPGQNTRTLMVRLQCRERRDCAPFWAEVSFSQPSAIHLAIRGSAGKANNSSKLSLVRPGHPAILVCDQGGLRISMRVLPLKRAGMGESIKVLDPDTRRVFSAEVRGADLVWSHLQESK